MSDDNRYAPFTEMNQAKFQINFKSLPSASCLIKEMIVNQNQCSSYDAWAKMGSRTYSSKKELELLKEVSQPGIALHHESIVNGELNITTYMEPLEVRMIDIMFD